MKKILCVFLFLPLLAFGDTPRGEKLLNRLWKDIKAGHVNKIKHYTSENFQAITCDGIFNRKQEMDFLKSLTVISYKLSNVQVTECENIITVAYQADVVETINAKSINKTNGEMEVFSRRLAVWKKIGTEWKWVAEANFFTIPV